MKLSGSQESKMTIRDFENFFFKNDGQSDLTESLLQNTLEHKSPDLESIIVSEREFQDSAKHLKAIAQRTCDIMKEIQGKNITLAEFKELCKKYSRTWVLLDEEIFSSIDKHFFESPNP